MKLTLKTNTALQWRLSRMPLEQRHETEADIEDGSISGPELEALTQPLTLADFPTRAEKSAFVAQFGFEKYCDLLDETKRQRQAKQKEGQ